METELKSRNQNNDGDYYEEEFLFFDAFDEFPFHDCSSQIFEPIGADSMDSTMTLSEKLPQVSFENNDFNTVAEKIKTFPEINEINVESENFVENLKTLENFRLNLNSESVNKGKDEILKIKEIDGESELFFENSKTPETNKLNLSSESVGQGKHEMLKIKEIDGESEDFSGNSKTPEKIKLNLSSESVNRVIDEHLKRENEGDSRISNADTERIRGSSVREIHTANSSFLVLFTGLIIKAIGFQFNLLISFFTFPIWLMYVTFMFVMDPFRVVKRGRQYLIRRAIRICGCVFGNFSALVYKWLKDHKYILKWGLKFGWGMLWSVYVCVVLVVLLVSAFVVGGILMRIIVEEPIRMQESIDFDYTEKSPVAFVSIMVCPEAGSGPSYGEQLEVSKLDGMRVIPPKHKLQVTVSLTLPESEYNRNLGIFQVRVDLLAAGGKVLASSRRPCMLHFKSQPIRLLLTFLKVAPLLTGYTSETQDINVKLKGFTEGVIPTACLKVILEQRAQFQSGAGIPEIYSASLVLESEQPLLKRIMWYWQKTLFVWISLTMFVMELVFTLVFCKPIIIPRVRLR